MHNPYVTTYKISKQNAQYHRNETNPMKGTPNCRLNIKMCHSCVEKYRADIICSLAICPRKFDGLRE